jgi:hypothetical protein
MRFRCINLCFVYGLSWDEENEIPLLLMLWLSQFMPSTYCSECCHCVFTDDGISIPCSYTSYLCPVQSSKLYNEVKLCKEKDKHELNHFETPYVVHLQNKFQLATTQPLFTFFHPNKGKKVSWSESAASPAPFCVCVCVCVTHTHTHTGLEFREYGHRDPSLWPRDTLYSQTLALICQQVVFALLV